MTACPPITAHLLLVPHGAAAEDRHLGHGARLQLLQRAAARPQQLAHEVELRNEFVLTTITSRFPQFQEVETWNILKVFIKFSITIVPGLTLGCCLVGTSTLVASLTAFSL